MSNQPPIEVPQGAIRFNTDSQKLEFFAQDRWYGMATDVPTLDGGVRGVFGGGYQPSEKDVIDFVTISTAGNATDFGNLTEARGSFDASGSRTRGFWFGGENPATDRIDFITFSSTGDATDFGNLTVARFGTTAGSNETRAVIAGGNYPKTNVIDYVTMSSAGDAVDFGDLIVGMRRSNAGNSPTRVIFYGGSDSPASNANTQIQFVTTATLGNSQDFGEPFSGGYSRSKGVICSSTRALFAGNDVPESNIIESITMSTLGNGIAFGDLPVSGTACGGRLGCSSVTRGLSAGGQSPFPNTIDYVSISTGGTAVDFGDLTVSRAFAAGCSNGHGGL